MVRHFFPQSYPAHLKTNTNYPPQGKISEQHDMIFNVTLEKMIYNNTFQQMDFNS